MTDDPHIRDFSHVLEESTFRWIICKVIRLGYMPSWENGIIGVSDSDGYWKHLGLGICWLTKPNPG